MRKTHPHNKFFTGLMLGFMLGCFCALAPQVWKIFSRPPLQAKKPPDSLATGREKDSRPSPKPGPSRQAISTGEQLSATEPTKQLFFSSSLSSFSLHKMGTGDGPTLLIVGGIQGDEPGGFSAAALVASHYTIHKGTVWVVPDLNMPSIITRSRGVAGDMNRKFASLQKSDPDFKTVAKIKNILLDNHVDLILNLHDGSGFYRKTYDGPLHNPTRWGQSIIIDQEEISAPRFAQLRDLAEQVMHKANAFLLKPEHCYNLRNTQTRLGDTEMAKTLSYFAICNGKPAFGLEASKEFTTEYRSYYHLQLIEAFMQHMGIAFERDFELSPSGVSAALNSNLAISLFNNQLILPLDNIRPQLNYVPFKKGESPNTTASKPLLLLLPEKDGNWRIAYGNRTLTKLHPTFIDFDDSLTEVQMLLDDKPETVPVGTLVHAQNSFMITVPPGYRVNAIGAVKEKNGTEAGVLLSKTDFAPRFSVDKAGTIFRIEIYKKNAFSGMILIRFSNTPASRIIQAGLKDFFSLTGR